MIRISFPVEIRAAESKRLFIRLGVSVGQYRGDSVQG
jgi:hypothetical protein